MGIVAPVAVLMLPTKDIFDTVIGILRLCPHFAFAHGLIWLGFTYAGSESDEPSVTFDMDITGKDLIYMAATAVGYFGLLLVAERCVSCFSYDFLHRLPSCLVDPRSGSTQRERNFSETLE